MSPEVTETETRPMHTNAEISETEPRPTDTSAEVAEVGETKMQPADTSAEVGEIEPRPTDTNAEVAEVGETESRPDLLWNAGAESAVILVTRRFTPRATPRDVGRNPPRFAVRECGSGGVLLL